MTSVLYFLTSYTPLTPFNVAFLPTSAHQKSPSFLLLNPSHVLNTQLLIWGKILTLFDTRFFFKFSLPMTFKALYSPHVLVELFLSFLIVFF